MFALDIFLHVQQHIKECSLLQYILVKTIKVAYDIAILPPNKPVEIGAWGPGWGCRICDTLPSVFVNHEKLPNKLYTWIYLPVIVDFKTLKKFISNSFIFGLGLNWV